MAIIVNVIVSDDGLAAISGCLATLLIEVHHGRHCATPDSDCGFSRRFKIAVGKGVALARNGTLTKGTERRAFTFPKRRHASVRSILVLCRIRQQALGVVPIVPAPDQRPLSNTVGDHSGDSIIPILGVQRKRRHPP